MFKRITLFSLLISSGLQLQAVVTKSSLNVKETFETIEKHVNESNNQHAHDAFAKFSQSKEKLKNYFNDEHHYQIRSWLNHTKAKLVTENEKSIFAFRNKKLLEQRYKDDLTKQIDNIKTCNSDHNCQELLLYVFDLLLFADLIKK